MIDITSVGTGPNADIGLYDSQAPKAGNILSVQIGALEYAQTFGIDLKYFLSENLRFQNESFRSYMIEVLANWGVNVASVDEVIETLFMQMTINVSPDENSTALIAG